MNAVDTALFSRLSSATALTALLPGTTNLYHLQAPEGATLPYIVWNIQGGGDENLDANRTKNLVYYIRTYSENSAGEAGSIDLQIDAAIHMLPLTVSGYTNIWLARETAVETVSTEPSGKIIWSAGAMYRIWLDKN